MKRKHFKKIKKKHLETCKTLIKRNGRCYSISCWDCPFNDDNVTNGKTCGINKYSDNGIDGDCKDPKLLKSAKKFLKKFEYLTIKQMVKEMLKGKTLIAKTGEKMWYDPIYDNPFRFRAVNEEGVNQAWTTLRWSVK